MKKKAKLRVCEALRDRINLTLFWEAWAGNLKNKEILTQSNVRAFWSAKWKGRVNIDVLSYQRDMKLIKTKVKRKVTIIMQHEQSKLNQVNKALRDEMKP